MANVDFISFAKLYSEKTGHYFGERSYFETDFRVEGCVYFFRLGCYFCFMGFYVFKYEEGFGSNALWAA